MNSSPSKLRRMVRCSATGAMMIVSVGCSTIPGVGGGDIHMSTRCLSLDGLKEINAASNEKPKVQLVVDRVDTAARIIDLGDIVMHTLPISAGSTWPNMINASVPLTSQVALEQELRRDPKFIPSPNGQISPVKLKVSYVEKFLFSKYPSVYEPRVNGATVPTEADVTALAIKVLGQGYSPMFTKNFYRFLSFSPAFEPRAELFTEKLNGRAVEVYPSLFDAVRSLADNREELISIQNGMLQAEEKRSKLLRDVEETVQRIHDVKEQEFIPNNTEGAQQPIEGSRHKEIEDLEQRLEVQRQDFDASVNAYKEELEKLSVELGKIKTQLTAFSPEQQALAGNIQSAVDAVLGGVCQCELLLFIAGKKSPDAIKQWKQEMAEILMDNQKGKERVKWLSGQVVTLPSSVKHLSTRVGVLTKEAEVYDDLYVSRLGECSFIDKSLGRCPK